MNRALVESGHRRNFLVPSMRGALFVLPLMMFATLSAALLGSSGTTAVLIATTIAFLVVLSGYGLLVDRAWKRQLQRKIVDAEQHRKSHRQVEELFAMTDMFQAAENHADAAAILKATSQRLVPDFSGALYIFNNSRDRLDLADSWNLADFDRFADVLVPGNCWAMKRGKPHINSLQDKTLCCSHERPQAATLELPMIAQGQIHGLLLIGCDDEGAFDRLMEVRRTGRALADSLSLASSNIALRESCAPSRCAIR